MQAISAYVRIVYQFSREWRGSQLAYRAEQIHVPILLDWCQDEWFY